MLDRWWKRLLLSAALPAAVLIGAYADDGTITYEHGAAHTYLRVAGLVLAIYLALTVAGEPRHVESLRRLVRGTGAALDSEAARTGALVVVGVVLVVVVVSNAPAILTGIAIAMGCLIGLGLSR